MPSAGAAAPTCWETPIPSFPWKEWWFCCCSLLFHHLVLFLPELPGCSRALIWRVEVRGGERSTYSARSYSCCAIATLPTLCNPCCRNSPAQALLLHLWKSWKFPRVLPRCGAEGPGRLCGTRWGATFLLWGPFCPARAAGRAGTGCPHREGDPEVAELCRAQAGPDGFLDGRAPSATDRLPEGTGGGGRYPAAPVCGPGDTFGVALVALLCFTTPLGASRPLHCWERLGSTRCSLGLLQQRWVGARL